MEKDCEKLTEEVDKYANSIKNGTSIIIEGTIVSSNVVKPKITKIANYTFQHSLLELKDITIDGKEKDKNIFVNLYNKEKRSRTNRLLRIIT